MFRATKSIDLTFQMIYKLQAMQLIGISTWEEATYHATKPGDYLGHSRHSDRDRVFGFAPAAEGELSRALPPHGLLGLSNGHTLPGLSAELLHVF